MLKHKRKFGFTLIEVMVTVMIISVLTALGYSFVGPSSKRTTRNNRRMTDLGSLQQSLENYRNDKGGYPSAGNYACSAAQPSWCFRPAYIAVIPTDPSTAAAYSYVPTGCGGNTCTGYSLTANLENTTGGTTPSVVSNP